MNVPRRVNVQAISLRGVGNTLGHNGQAFTFAQTQPYVFSHGQGVEQAEMLKHHADTQCTGFLRVAWQSQHAINCHAACVRLDRAVNNLHQR